MSSFQISNILFFQITQLFKGLISLKSLSLNMGSSDGITNPGLRLLSEIFFNTEPRFLLYGFSYIDDKSLNSLSQGLKIKISLRNISFSFVNCKRILDFGIEYLSKGLKDLVLLKSLSLNFDHCKLIINGGLIYLRKVVKKLENLQRVNLNFSYCTKNSLYGVEEIFQTFKTLPSFQNIIIKVHNYSYAVKVKQSKLKIRQEMDHNFLQGNWLVEFNSLRELFSKCRVYRNLT